MSKFPGVWATESGRLVYRVLPKCACSSIGQAMYFSDHGRFYEGDIHDATEGVLKWDQERNRPRIAEMVEGEEALRFTCVRNPFTRILSAFFDKICGVQRNGARYRSGLAPMLAKRYGVEVEGEFDQIASFRRFLLFVRDTVRFRRPLAPDIHWIPMSAHLGFSARHGFRLDHVFAVENFASGMAEALAARPGAHEVDLAAMPRFNESEGHGPKRAHDIAAFFDDLSLFIMLDVYRKDFQLFKYDMEPGAGGPRKPPDLEEIRARLAR